MSWGFANVVERPDWHPSHFARNAVRALFNPPFAPGKSERHPN